MKDTRNTVYWIIRKTYDIPQRNEWDDCIFESDISSEQCIESICNRISSSRGKYVIVTDVENKDDLKRFHDHFISNNIINMVSGYDGEKIEKQIRWIFNDYGKTIHMNGDKIFFCSDLHFNHRNIIRYCNRPWNSGFDSDNNMIITDEDVMKMNEDMISNWNSVVGKDDTVYFLGDFCFGKNKREDTRCFRELLNGKISIILGNHDLKDISAYYEAGFERVYDKPILWNDFFILSHEPVQWIKNGDVYANFFGHVHNQEMYRHITQNTYNCCVEVNDYKPVSFSKIIEKMRNA